MGETFGRVVTCSKKLGGAQMAHTATCLDLSATYSESDFWRFPTLPLYRAMISVLVAVAILLTPLAAAWAGGAKGVGVPMLHTVPHAVEHEGTSDVSGMEDCASMMKGKADADDCACCDKDRACPPQLCLAKCFQLVSLTEQSRSAARLVATQFRPTTPSRPPDWSDQPQPPPPRT